VSIIRFISIINFILHISIFMSSLWDRYIEVLRFSRCLCKPYQGKQVICISKSALLLILYRNCGINEKTNSPRRVCLVKFQNYTYIFLILVFIKNKGEKTEFCQYAICFFTCSEKTDSSLFFEGVIFFLVGNLNLGKLVHNQVSLITHLFKFYYDLLFTNQLLNFIDF
jgi:hypothetical protein